MADLIHILVSLNYFILQQKKYLKLTQNEKINNCREKPLLLFSALDWGLGHTTRSIPLLKQLQQEGWNIIVACNSVQKELLAAEIPDLRFEKIPGYNIRYGTGSLSTKLRLLWQIPKILIKIKEENRWLDGFLEKNAINAVLSDNRYGLYNRKTTCIFITHQLAPKSGFGRFFDRLLQKFLYSFIRRFNECWVPDRAHQEGLAGELSHPSQMPPVPVHYLGCLSRFSAGTPAASSVDLLVLISGPEPQRSYFEQVITKELAGFKGSAALVRGLPGKEPQVHPPDAGNVRVFNHLPAIPLQQLIAGAQLVICRSGYTTLMDMLALKKKIVVVPTPGQAEQEYLAGWVHRQGWALAAVQDQLALKSELARARTFHPRYPDKEQEKYQDVLRSFSARVLG